MYEKIIRLLAGSNIGSFIKEDIIQNNLIRKDGDEFYYRTIEKILLSDKTGLQKESELTEYLINNSGPDRNVLSDTAANKNLYSRLIF